MAVAKKVATKKAAPAAKKAVAPKATSDDGLHLAVLPFQHKVPVEVLVLGAPTDQYLALEAWLETGQRLGVAEGMADADGILRGRVQVDEPQSVRFELHARHLSARGGYPVPWRLLTSTTVECVRSF